MLAKAGIKIIGAATHTPPNAYQYVESGSFSALPRMRMNQTVAAAETLMSTASTRKTILGTARTLPAGIGYA